MTNKEKLLILSEMYAEAVENGNGFLVKNGSNNWVRWIKTTKFPDADDDLNRWKVAPKSNIVSLEWAIKSKVDMVFSNSNFTEDSLIDILNGIKKDTYFCSREEDMFEQCRFRLNHWILHEGEHTVPPEGLNIKIRCNDGPDVDGHSIGFDWTIATGCDAIIAYQILGVDEDYSYLWENK